MRHMPMANLPSYDELPVKEGAPQGSSWGLWGDGDVFGCLNLLTPERIVAAAKLVQTGAVFALNLELELPDPPFYGRARPKHTVLGEGVSHDDVLEFNTQSSSQWDGFRHISAPEGFYNGVADASHGMHFWAKRGIVGRGVLVDVARHRDLAPNEPTVIETADLDAALDAQGTRLEPGDVLLMRTGWTSWYRTLDEQGREAYAADYKAPGLRPTKDTARWLWDHHVAAIASDNLAVEVWPLLGAFGHFDFLARLGIPLGELWDLDALAEDCAADGRYTFLFTSAPLNVHAGVASPPNALAIK